MIEDVARPQGGRKLELNPVSSQNPAFQLVVYRYQFLSMAPLGSSKRSHVYLQEIQYLDVCHAEGINFQRGLQWNLAKKRDFALFPSSILSVLNIGRVITLRGEGGREKKYTETVRGRGNLFTKFSQSKVPRKLQNLLQMLFRNRYWGFTGSQLKLVVQVKYLIQLS